MYFAEDKGFANFTSVLAYGPRGLAWRAELLHAWDGFVLTRQTAHSLFGPTRLGDVDPGGDHVRDATGVVGQAGVLPADQSLDPGPGHQVAGGGSLRAV